MKKGGKTMRKGFQNVKIAICVFYFLGGCASKTKTSLKPMVTPEVKEEVVIEPSEIKPGEQGSVDSQAEITETALEHSLTPAKYPGIEGEFLESSMVKDIHFDFDKADLTLHSRQILSENATILKKFPNAKIQIEGHCDERGSTDYNLALGERRAVSVKNYLISLDISFERLSTISYGEEIPIDTRHNKEAWAKNRRSHLIITKN